MIQRWACPPALRLLGPVAIALAIGLHAAPAFPQAAVVEVPLAGPALVHAQAAFSAYDRKDYPAAISEIREALRQRPDAARLKRLLVYALAANGQFDDAAVAAKDLVAAGDQDPALLAELDRLEGRLPTALAPDQPVAPAYASADEAYRAYAKGNYASAVKAAQKALRAEPANTNYRRLLDNARAALNAPKPSPAYLPAQEAYAAMAAKDYDRAAASAGRAVQLAPASREYRLLLVQALSQTDDLEAAISAADAALRENGPDSRLYAARGYAEQRVGRPAAAAADFTLALANQPEATEERSLRLALADAALAAKDPARALAVLIPDAAESSYDVASRRGFALLALDRPAEALEALKVTAASADTPEARGRIMSGEISALSKLGEQEQAQSLFKSALDSGAFSGTSPVEVAYMALAAGDDQEAARSFAAAKSEGTLPARANFDAAYAAVRLWENDKAISYFKDGLDAASAGKMPLDPQARFNVRRQISDMDRRWGGSVSVNYGATGVMPGTSATTIAPAPIQGQKVTDRIAQAGTEIYWRPPQIGYRDGSIFELFARTFDTISDENGGATGIGTMQAYTGARWKPFGRINFVLEASRLWGIGSHTHNDYLLRAAYSTGQGTDLRVDVPSWFMWQIYGEADRYFETPQTLFSFEARSGRSYNVGEFADGLVLTPFVALGTGYDSLLKTSASLGAGPGVSARLWFNSDTYHAPRSYLDISVQYRVQLAGGSQARGVFANITLAF